MTDNTREPRPPQAAGQYPKGAAPTIESSTAGAAPADNPVVPPPGDPPTAIPSAPGVVGPQELPPGPQAPGKSPALRTGWRGPPGSQGRPKGVLNGEGKPTHNPSQVHWWYERLADWMIANPHLSMKDAAREFGRSYAWILQLKNSDTFQRYWREKSGIASGECIGAVRSKAFAAAEASLDLLNEKLEKLPETFTVGGLLEVVDTTMKRFGYDTGARASASQQVNVNIGLVSPAELESARERMRARVSAVEVLSQAKPAKEAEEVDSGGWSDG